MEPLPSRPLNPASDPYRTGSQGFNITVHERAGTFGLTIQRRETGKSVTGRKRYPSEGAAKEAGLKALLWAEEHLV